MSLLKFGNLSESLCEDALEILQEIVGADASLQMWFDRALAVVNFTTAEMANY